MIKDVTIPARLCRCEICLYEWLSIAVQVPVNCQNRECRSREWNGIKERKPPAPKPSVILPKPTKVRGGNDDDF